MELTILILAAGYGKRMRSEIPKVLHKVGDVTMITRITTTASILKPAKIVVLVNKDNHRSIEEELITNGFDKICYVIQDVPQGTGDAVRYALPHLKGTIMILNGDCPLIESELLDKIRNQYDNRLLITITESDTPQGNGRIVMSEKDVIDIIEEKDCDEEQRLIKLVNCGIYVVSKEMLDSVVPKLTNDNAQREYYLTDIVKLCDKVEAFVVEKEKQYQLFNINSREQLEEANKMIV